MHNILPDLTTCSEIFFIGENGSLHSKLPLTKFVTTAHSMHLLIYAYGGYVYLSRITVQLHITETPYRGIIVGCVRPTGDGYIQLYTREFFKTSQQWLEHETVGLCYRCNNPLHALFYSVKSFEDIFFFFTLLYCDAGSKLVTVHLRDFLQSDLLLGNMCVEIQTNLYQTLTNNAMKRCYFQNAISLSRKETLDTHLTASAHCQTVSVNRLLPEAQGCGTTETISHTECQLLFSYRVLHRSTDMRNLVMANGSTPTFGVYSYLWTQDKFTWNQAYTSCMQLGSHLASISSDQEFNIVKDLLAGRGYTLPDTDSHVGEHVEYSILTPCRLESRLCMIYLGLRSNVRPSTNL